MPLINVGAAGYGGPVRLSSGTTIVPKSGAICDTRFHVCDTFSYVDCGTRYTAPTYKGVQLDWCLDFASDCGQAAADYFCKTKGSTGAAAFDGPVPLNSGTTILPKSGAICNTNYHGCDTFRSIDCN